jgi:hypothetical protein
VGDEHRLFSQNSINSKTDNKRYHLSAPPAHRRSDRPPQSPKMEPRSAAKTRLPAGNSPTALHPLSSPPDKHSVQSSSVPHPASSAPKTVALARNPYYTTDRPRQCHRTAFPPRLHGGRDSRAPIDSAPAPRSQREPSPKQPKTAQTTLSP